MVFHKTIFKYNRGKAVMASGIEQGNGMSLVNKKKHEETGWRQAFAYSFPKTIPVMVGYIFLGTAYGILMSVNGFGIGWAMAMSIFVYAGSLQYVGINLLVAAASPFTAFLMALMINARHLFYGISMLGKYSGMGKVRAYLIFGLTDETFSVVCNEEIPKGLSGKRRYVWITFLNQLYWISGTMLGAVAGSMITFNTKGLDFALTALFVVIFTEQWMTQRDHKPALIGVFSAVASLAVFGTDTFIIPSMVLILFAVSLGYKKEENGRIDKNGKEEEEQA